MELTQDRTLYGMFPNLDKDVIEDVVRQKDGRYVFDLHAQVVQMLIRYVRVGQAVDACLALTAGA